MHCWSGLKYWGRYNFCLLLLLLLLTMLSVYVAVSYCPEITGYTGTVLRETGGTANTGCTNFRALTLGWHPWLLSTMLVRLQWGTSSRMCRLTSCYWRRTVRTSSPLRSVSTAVNSFLLSFCVQFCVLWHILRATAATAVAHLSHRNFVCLSACPSVTGVDRWKTLQTRICLKDSSFRIHKAFP